MTKPTKDGFLIDYHGDQLLWIWPWNRTSYHHWLSKNFECKFENLRDYWHYVGAFDEACRKRKILGFSESEVFQEWAKTKFKRNIVVILRNANIELKTGQFWRTINLLDRQELIKDVSVLFFSTVGEAKKVADSIAPEFAEVHLFARGEPVY